MEWIGTRTPIGSNVAKGGPNVNGAALNVDSWQKRFRKFDVHFSLFIKRLTKTADLAVTSISVYIQTSLISSQWMLCPVYIFVLTTLPDAPPMKRPWAITRKLSLILYYFELSSSDIFHQGQSNVNNFYYIFRSL